MPFWNYRNGYVVTIAYRGRNSQQTHYSSSSFAHTPEFQAKAAQHRMAYLYKAHADNLQSQMLLIRRLWIAIAEYISQGVK